MTTPLICGTMVRNSGASKIRLPTDEMINNMSFDRKLRMIRADLFALLSISTNSDFISKGDLSLIIKKSIEKFTEGELNQRV